MPNVRNQTTTIKQLLATTLILMLGISQALPARAQVGPPQPHEKGGTQDNSKLEALKQKFGQMFTPQDSETDPDDDYVEVRRGAGMPGQFDTVKVKRDHVAPKAAASKQQQPARPPLLNQPELTNPKIDDAEVSQDNPPQDLPTLDNPENPLGLAVAQTRLNETAKLIDSKHIYDAKTKLVPLKEWLVESTENHISLYKVLNNVPSARVQAELEKQVALDFARMRDKAFFQMGKVHMAENDMRNAIKMFIEVVKSQPRGDIGLQAYDLLQQIGFTQKLQLVE